jgi:hypothetical protein
MRKYEIKGVEHLVFDVGDEIPDDIEVVDDWRNSTVNDWVLADDGCVIQVLRKSVFRTRNGGQWTIGTVTGTFLNGSKSMDTEPRESRYSLGGKHSDRCIADRKEMTTNETLFARELTRGTSPEDAYIKIYRTNDRKYARVQAGILVKTERISRAMKEELKPVLKSLGISPEMILTGIRDIALSEESKDNDRLRALFELGEILELKEVNKVTEVAGALFQGFAPEEIASTQRPQLKEV